jgi:hypothetical protein
MGRVGWASLASLGLVGVLGCWQADSVIDESGDSVGPVGTGSSSGGSSNTSSSSGSSSSSSSGSSSGGGSSGSDSSSSGSSSSGSSSSGSSSSGSSSSSGGYQDAGDASNSSSGATFDASRPDGGSSSGGTSSGGSDSGPADGGSSSGGDSGTRPDSGSRDSATESGTTTAAACTWPGSSSYQGSGSFTWFYFGQGTSQQNGQYKTACGYTGTESGQVDTVANIANSGIAKNTYFAAIPGANNFDTVGDCGMCVEITNGGTKIVATVIDECPTDNGQNSACAQAGHLDLSYAAWKALGYSVGNPSGTSWKAVGCPVTGNIVATLNSEGQIYFQNLAFPIKSVTSGGSQATQTQYGYWNVSSGSVTLTDVLGQSVTGNVPGNGGDIGVQFPTAPASCY